jgi:hypothetical protein
MSETTKDVLATVDSVLAGKELKGQPRAFLLLRLGQLSLLFFPDKTEHYWTQLVPLQSKIPKELQTNLEDLRSIMESTSRSGAKGFAAEVIADVDAAKKLAASDIEEAKRRLQDCESRLEKRRWPFGKAQAQIALVEAWADVDRQHALQLLGTIPANVRESLVRRMNRANPLLAEEWKIVAAKASMGQAVQIAIKILDDDQPLHLPREVLLQVGAQIRNSMQAVTTPQGEAELTSSYARYAKLIRSQTSDGQADLVQTLLEELYAWLVKTNSLDQIWTMRFILLGGVLSLGVSLQALIGETLGRWLTKTPAHLSPFVRAHYAALTTPPDAVEDAYKALLSQTGQNRDAEAWFLVTLVERGLSAEALALAERSSQAGELLPRLRRAWLCTHPESAGSAISAQDMAGDPIGEFLAQGAVQDRVAYLRKATDGGKRSVPGAMWAGKGTEEQAEGLRGFWKSLTSSRKTLDQIVMEYLALNPLYSSYRRDTKKETQFGEYLRISGYGEYKYADVDQALLETLVAWGDEDAGQVKSVLRAMWSAIQPDDQMLMVDWLRNAILTRCRNVIAADPEVLTQDFLGWFKRELVDKGRSWKIGNTQVTLKYPDTMLLQFCVASAMTVSKFSPDRRDQILLSGLSKFKGDAAGVEAAAQLYNTDKEMLDLTPPLQLKPDLVEAWQLGIVKNAIPLILRTMVAQASG